MIVQKSDSNNRIYGLDILRALAILSVLLYHAADEFLPANVFSIIQFFYVIDPLSFLFVLSGYLIAGILIHKTKAQNFGIYELSHFLRQRFLRTLPVYFFALITIIMCRSLNDTAFSTRDTWPYFFFLQNFRSYDIFFFEESWSMSVEVWFYAGTAIALWIVSMLRTFSTIQWLTIIACLTIVAIPCVRYYKFTIHPPVDITGWLRSYRLIVTSSLDAPMYGVLAACFHEAYAELWFRFKNRLAALFLFLISILCIYLFYYRDSIFTNLFYSVFIYTLYGCMFALLLPFFSNMKKGKGIRLTIITYLSLRSYSMYLVHSGIVINFILNTKLKSFCTSMIMQYQSIGYGILFLLFWVLTLGLSEIIYRLIEAPFTNYRKRLK